MVRIHHFAVILVVGGCLSIVPPASSKGSHRCEKVPRFARQEQVPELYSTLASYYRSRQREFQLQAESEHHEWVRRSQFTAPPLMKYPRPEISSRYRYEYFAYQAKEMNRLAEYYDHLEMHWTQDPASETACAAK